MIVSIIYCVCCAGQQPAVAVAVARQLPAVSLRRASGPSRPALSETATFHCEDVAGAQPAAAGSCDGLQHTATDKRPS